MFFDTAMDGFTRLDDVFDAKSLGEGAQTDPAFTPKRLGAAGAT